MKTLSIDIETFSSENLTKCGVYRYAEAPDFEVLLFGYSADGAPVKVVDLAAGEKIPADVRSALTDPAVTKWAFNVKQGEKLYLSAELEALSKAEQREAMESDEREGLVRLYLDTLLPEGWDGMDIFERRNFLTGSDFGDTQKHGTVKRTQVSNMEIWCECFGKERANIRRTDSNELTAILARLGWKRLDSKVRIPLYGPQYVFVPKECS